MKKITFKIKDLDKPFNGRIFTEECIKGICSAYIPIVTSDNGDYTDISSIKAVGITKIIPNYPDIEGNGSLNEEIIDDVKSGRLGITALMELDDVGDIAELSYFCLSDKTQCPNSEIVIQEFDDLLWCEDCKYFTRYDMGGEGFCDIDDSSTWYGRPICEKFEEKE